MNIEMRYAYKVSNKTIKISNLLQQKFLKQKFTVLKISVLVQFIVQLIDYFIVQLIVHS